MAATVPWQWLDHDVGLVCADCLEGMQGAVGKSADAHSCICYVVRDCAKSIGFGLVGTGADQHAPVRLLQQLQVVVVCIDLAMQVVRGQLSCTSFLVQLRQAQHGLSCASGHDSHTVHNAISTCLPYAETTCGKLAY